MPAVTLYHYPCSDGGCSGAGAGATAGGITLAGATPLPPPRAAGSRRSAPHGLPRARAHAPQPWPSLPPRHAGIYAALASHMYHQQNGLPHRLLPLPVYSDPVISDMGLQVGANSRLAAQPWGHGPP
jgi:hypothetical protein